MGVTWVTFRCAERSQNSGPATGWYSEYFRHTSVDVIWYYMIFWLVVWNMIFIFPHIYIYGISSYQLTFIFFRGVGIPPTSIIWYYIYKYVNKTSISYQYRCIHLPAPDQNVDLKYFVVRPCTPWLCRFFFNVFHVGVLLRLPVSPLGVFPGTKQGGF